MKYKVFISSTQKELKEERSEIKRFVETQYLLKEYFQVFLFEDVPARSKSAERVYLEEVADSEIYIGLFWNEYGMAGEDKISSTEKEYRKAKELQKEILIFIKGRDEAKRDKRLIKLISELKDGQCGHCYERFETTDDLTNSLYSSLIDFLKKEGVIIDNAFDESACKNTSLTDIDEDKIRWFLKTAKEKRKYPLDINTSIKDALTHLNLLNHERPTNAAILLFGKNPHRFHITAETKCLQFSGTEVEKPFASYHIYDGNLFEQIDKAVSFVLDAIHYPVIQQAHTAQVKRQHEIPVFAITEAVVNAVAHRDYHSGASVQVMVFIDRVEIWNPGRLPDTISVNDLRKSHTSHPRNPLIANVLYFADYIQKAGSGTIEMIKQCRAKGLPEPEFVATRHEFRTILARDLFTETTLAKTGLNERQLKAVKHVKEKGSISNKIYREICSTSERTATRDLAELVSLKVLEQIGITGKGTEYKLRRHKDAKDVTMAPE